MKPGRVVFSQMDEVLFGHPAATAVAEEVKRVDARRVFLMVSGTLNRTTDEIGKIRPYVAAATGEIELVLGG